jgi:hypothetical protein
MNERSRILHEADGLINGDRQKDYGTPRANFARVARIWSVILGVDVTAHEVALCMAGLKLARLANGPHRDSYLDGVGYLALAGELALVDDPDLPLG